MEPSASLAALLRQHMQRAGYTADRLEKESTVPKSTIVNWTEGRTKRPRDWQPLLLVAAALHLNEQEASTLLIAAGHLPLGTLRPTLHQWFPTITSSTQQRLVKQWMQPEGNSLRSSQGEDSWIGEVEAAFTRFHRPDELVPHAVQRWPAVQERVPFHASTVEAVRSVLRAAITELAMHLPDAATMLRDTYLRADTSALQAVERGLDSSIVQRQRTRALHEVALILAEHNRRAERQARVRRFAVQHPVVGVEPVKTDLVARLRDEIAPPVVVLEGMGGLGKTTLAKLIAQHFVHDDTFVRVLWASAQQVQWDHWNGRQQVLLGQPGDSASIVRQLAHELAIDTHGNLHTLQTEVVAHCTRRPYLVIIDNLETVADMAALAPLIGALAGASRVLITTRDRAIHALPADLPRQYVSLGELDAPTSMQLLRNAAMYTGATAIQTADDAELQRIYAVTGGNPLALWLVAGQVVNVAWHTFLTDLVERCPPGSTSDELYTFLYRRLWEQLSADAQLVLFAMHRCEAGADYALLLVLSDLQHDTCVRAVEELRRYMLLLFDGTTYTIHRLTYTFLRAVIAGWT